MLSLYQKIYEFLGFSPILILLAVIAAYNVAGAVSARRTQAYDLKTKKRPDFIGYPTVLPWLLPNFRTRLRSFVDVHKWMTKGYNEYSRKGKPFQVCTSHGQYTVLPFEFIDEVKNASPDDIDNTAAEDLEAYYTMGPQIMNNLYHVPIVRRDLTAKINSFTPEIVAETDLAMEKYFEPHFQNTEHGEWVEVPVFRTMIKVVMQSSFRILVGSLSRNDEFQDAVINYAEMVIPISELIKLWPEGAKPYVGPIIGIPVQRAMEKGIKLLRPIIEQRIADIARGLPEAEQPNDFLQWIIREAPNQGKDNSSVHGIGVRMMVVAFAAVHTTTMSTVYCIYHLAFLESQRKPSEGSLMKILRDEAREALSPPNSFDKQSLMKLYNLDAFMKETLRLELTAALGFMRLVKNPKGWTLSNGLHFPCGSRLGFALRDMNHDDDVYPHGSTHDYTRFYRGDVAEKKQSELDENNEKSEKPTTFSGRKLDRYMVSVSKEYLPFSYGSHACPGRWFAANEMRIPLSYLLLNYDMKPLEELPKNMWMSQNRVLDMTKKMEFRKREKFWQGS